VAEEKGLIVAIDTTITAELQTEGWARDLVRQIQTLRKEADYELDQRITVGLFSSDQTLRDVLAPWQPHIMEETLATRLLTEDDGAAWDQRTETTINGHPLVVAVRAHEPRPMGGEA